MGFIILTIFLGIGYIFINREIEVVNTYFYDNRSNTLGFTKISPFIIAKDEPPWLKKDHIDFFWVFRFMYYWRSEITYVPHDDWERVEIWVDAKNGDVKWIVSDYHYRELWYKVEQELNNIYIKFFINWHTPIPIIDQSDIISISKILEKNSITHATKSLVTGKIPEIDKYVDDNTRPSKTLKIEWNKYHNAKWISEYQIDELPKFIPILPSEFCSKLPWKFWRYPFGVKNPRKREWYKNLQHRSTGPYPPPIETS